MRLHHVPVTVKIKYLWSFKITYLNESDALKV